jgi:Tetratricopeptide repeat
MMSRMFRRFFLVCLLLAVPAASTRAQTSGAVKINTDMRLFTAMVALNAAGYDVEVRSQYHPVRMVARNVASQLSPDLVTRLKAFYESHKHGQSDDAQFSKYLSLALSLTDPPEFKITSREESLPPDAREVKDFADLMHEVYGQGKLTSLFNELRPQYDEEINLLAPQIRDQIVRTDAYLRVPLGGSSSQSLDIYVELAAPTDSVNVRSDQDNYYLILGHQTAPHLDDVRHAYLHFQLDRMVALNAGKVANGLALINLIKDVEGVQRVYTADFSRMMAESLIRAIELRMDRVMAAPAKDAVDGYYRDGLLLIPYFYEALTAFEAQDAGIRDQFPLMVKGIHVPEEQARFASTFMNIPVAKRSVTQAEVPAAEAAPPADPAHDLLKEGEAALNGDDNEKAKSAFQKVLSDYDRNNGAALYGLALIASREGDQEEARDYFERTTRSEDVDAGMKVWAYIYLARIFDLNCERDRALEYYQQAVKIGNNTRNAQSVAKDGLKKPYGGVCR